MYVLRLIHGSDQAYSLGKFYYVIYFYMKSNKNKNWLEMMISRYLGDDKNEIIRHEHITKILSIVSYAGAYYFMQNPKLIKMCIYQIIDNFI